MLNLVQIIKMVLLYLLLLELYHLLLLLGTHWHGGEFIMHWGVEASILYTDCSIVIDIQWHIG
jgi:hypothetical protein